MMEFALKKACKRCACRSRSGGECPQVLVCVHGMWLCVNVCVCLGVCGFPGDISSAQGEPHPREAKASLRSLLHPQGAVLEDWELLRRL